jgi:hypothetical protein
MMSSSMINTPLMNDKLARSRSKARKLDPKKVTQKNKGIRIIDDRAKSLILKGVQYKPKQDILIEDMYLPQLGYNTELEPLEGLDIEIEKKLGDCSYGELYEIGVEGEL